jgi:signal peptidase II
VIQAPSASAPPISRLGAAAYLLAALVVLLDQISKAWVMGPLNLAERGTIPVLPVFRLTLVMNRGVSFGLLRADQPLGRWLLVAAALGVVVFLIGWVRRTERPLFAAAVGLVVGGALGNNLIDRVRIGQVVDFLDFSGLYFPWVFNVADSAITLGVMLLLLDSLLPAGRKTAAP